VPTQPQSSLPQIDDVASPVPLLPFDCLSMPAANASASR
jgi:hypothetical protein